MKGRDITAGVLAIGSTPLVARAEGIIAITGRQGDTSVTRAIAIELLAALKAGAALDRLGGIELPEVGQPRARRHGVNGPHSWIRKGLDLNLDRIRGFDECECGAIRYICYAFRLGDPPYVEQDGEKLGCWGPVGRWTISYGRVEGT